MKIRYTLTDVDGGTDIHAVHDGLPQGVPLILTSAQPACPRLTDLDSRAIFESRREV